MKHASGKYNVLLNCISTQSVSDSETYLSNWHTHEKPNDLIKSDSDSILITISNTSMRMKSKEKWNCNIYINTFRQPETLDNQENKSL